MGRTARVRLAMVAFVLLATIGIVPSSEANKDPCDECGASCYRTYEPGWDDCHGAPSNCFRTTTC